MTLPDQIKALPLGKPSSDVVCHYTADQMRKLRDAAASLAADAITDIRHAVRWAPSSAHWSERLRHHLGDDARDGITRLEQELRREFAIKIDEYDARVQRMAEALEECRQQLQSLGFALRASSTSEIGKTIAKADEALREQKEQAR